MHRIVLWAVVLAALGACGADNRPTTRVRVRTPLPAQTGDTNPPAAPGDTDSPPTQRSQSQLLNQFRIGNWESYTEAFSVDMDLEPAEISSNMDFFKAALCPAANIIRGTQVSVREKVHAYAWIVATTHKNYWRKGIDGSGTFNIDYLWGGDLYDGINGNFIAPKNTNNNCRVNCGKTNHPFPQIGTDCSGFIFTAYKPIAPNSAFGYSRTTAAGLSDLGQQILPSQKLPSSEDDVTAYLAKLEKAARPGDILVNSGHVVMYAHHPETGKPYILENGYIVTEASEWITSQGKRGNSYEVRSSFQDNNQPVSESSNPDTILAEALSSCL